MWGVVETVLDYRLVYHEITRRFDGFDDLLVRYIQVYQCLGKGGFTFSRRSRDEDSFGFMTESGDDVLIQVIIIHIESAYRLGHGELECVR